MKKMNIISIGFIVMLLMSGSVFGDPGSEVPCPNECTSNNGVKIMPLGNSITEGFFGKKSELRAYRNYLYGMLMSTGDSDYDDYTLYNVDFVGNSCNGSDILPGDEPFDLNHEGHMGWWLKKYKGEHDSEKNNLYDYINGWLDALKPTDKKPDRVPDIILLMGGTNDINRLIRKYGKSKKEAGEIAYNSLVDLVKRIQKWITDNDRNTWIIVATIINAKNDKNKYKTYNDLIRENFPNPGTKDDLTGERIVIVDLNKKAGLIDSDYKDNYHPRYPKSGEMAGYKKIGKAWHDVIMSLDWTGDFVPFVVVDFYNIDGCSRIPPSMTKSENWDVNVYLPTEIEGCGQVDGYYIPEWQTVVNSGQTITLYWSQTIYPVGQ